MTKKTKSKAKAKAKKAKAKKPQLARCNVPHGDLRVGDFVSRLERRLYLYREGRRFHYSLEPKNEPGWEFHNDSFRDVVDSSLVDMGSGDYHKMWIGKITKLGKNYLKTASGVKIKLNDPDTRFRVSRGRLDSTYCHRGDIENAVGRLYGLKRHYYYLRRQIASDVKENMDTLNDIVFWDKDVDEIDTTANIDKIRGVGGSNSISNMCFELDEWRDKIIEAVKERNRLVPEINKHTGDPEHFMQQHYRFNKDSKD